MPRYAQINAEGYVVSDSHLSDTVERENMIPLEEDFDLTNKCWNGKKWEEYEPEPTPDPEPTQLDRIEAAVTASNEAIAQGAIDAYTLELMEGGIL